MTTQEFSNTFDTLLNSYASKAMFGDQAAHTEIVLDEYEKSVLLTQAQDIIVKQYFERTNTNLGFDDSERRQIDFSNLISVADSQINTPSSTDAFDGGWVINTPVKSGEHILFILNERLVLTKTSGSGSSTTTTTKTFVVVPINYHEYDRQMSKPFAQPLKKQAWRLIQDDSSNTEATKVEIIPTDAAKELKNSGYTAKYKIRYVRRPTPIVLVNLTDSGLTVDDKATVTECELNPILHMDILNKAVELAFSTRGGRAASRESKE